MAFEKLCPGDALAPGTMTERTAANGTRVLLLRRADGEWKAYQAQCPHAAVALVGGTLEAGILTCREHWWQFDTADGQGVNPTGCRLAAYPLAIVDADVCVDVAGIAPLKADRTVS